ncbi:LysR family transcriptional regulator [Dyella subtropica]|uniref:LysR family transcriptional regulator n=1 Tax=Dyella subtropica TaxID=2992127 RepID=UPI002250118C|nr:LysR family transcriptional regulator [Dyella subtropica]
MAGIDDYRVFIAVVEQGNLSAAARHLRCSLQTVSRVLAGLERELGVELIHRTTRRAQPSAAGLAFHARIKAALADIDLARSSLAEHGAKIEGSLRIGGSTQYAPVHVVPLMAAFMERYPDVEVELVVDDGHADLLRDRLDAAVRLGELPDSRLQARLLGRLRQIAFASPGYLAIHGRPRTPAELARHECVLRRSARDAQTWTFTRHGKSLPVEVEGRFSANNAAACNVAVAGGLGIGLAPLWQVRSLLDQGLVEQVLAPYGLPSMPVHIVWPASKQLPARTRAFIDFVASRWVPEA